jgi:NAD+ diphosphatase
MPELSARPPNPYAASPLDRAAHRRDDAEWIEAALAAQTTLWVPVWRARNLIRGLEEAQPEAVFLTGRAGAVIRTTGCEWAFLGLWADVPLFAADLGAADDPLPVLSVEAAQFADLRTVSGLLPPDDAAVLAHARALIHWRGRQRFCGVCASPCTSRSAGHVMKCTNPACATEHFPRTDPAVIMLVTHGDRALLGHASRFPGNMYSTLAGFVEPGESLEEAVAREVFEEAGVRVCGVQYHSSQPWPFPGSIMIGFYAKAVDDAIVLDRTELEDARWFTRAEIRDHTAHGFSVPRGDSIARRLIEDWVADA